MPSTASGILVLSLAAVVGHAQTRNDVAAAYEAFRARKFADVEQQLRVVLTGPREIEAFARELRRQLSGWPIDLGAAFALEAAAVAYEVDVAPFSRQAGGQGLESAVTLVTLGRDRLGRGCGEFALQWYRAAIALLDGPVPLRQPRPFTHRRAGPDEWEVIQHPDLPAGSRPGFGSGRPGFETIVTRALSRCPKEPAFWFAEALWNERFFYTYNRTFGTAAKYTQLSGNIRIGAADIGIRAEAAFTRVLSSDAPDLVALSTLHLGHVQFLRGHHQDAVATLSTVPSLTRNVDDQYLAKLFSGQALWAEQLFGDALGAFEAALIIRPRTPSGEAQLAALLALGDRWQDGATVAAQVLDTRLTAPDPWWTYFQPLYGEWPAHQQALRDMLR